MDATQRCPYCAEEIAAAAVRCRYCRSRIGPRDPKEWHRDRPERRLAGVAAAVARPLALPLPVVRVAFLVLTFVHFLGLVAYVALWLLIPFRPGDESLLERGLERLRALVGYLRDGRPEARGPLP